MANILAVLEVRNGALRKGAGELLAAARKLAVELVFGDKRDALCAQHEAACERRHRDAESRVRGDGKRYSGFFATPTSAGRNSRSLII